MANKAQTSRVQKWRITWTDADGTPQERITANHVPGDRLVLARSGARNIRITKIRPER